MTQLPGMKPPPDTPDMQTVPEVGTNVSNLPGSPDGADPSLGPLRGPYGTGPGDHSGTNVSKTTRKPRHPGLGPVPGPNVSTVPEVLGTVTTPTRGCKRYQPIPRRRTLREKEKKPELTFEA